MCVWLQVLEAVALEAGLADLARQALSSDPEAAAQLKRYEEAVVRLEKAKAAEKELEVIMQVRFCEGVEPATCPDGELTLACVLYKTVGGPVWGCLHSPADTSCTFGQSFRTDML